MFGEGLNMAQTLTEIDVNMALRNTYECTDCSTTVSPMSYRSCCPECGGDLAAGIHADHTDRKIPDFLRYGG